MNQTCKLSRKSCIPCKGDIPPLKREKISSLQTQLNESWNVVDEHHLEKTYVFPDFKAALLFTVKVGDVAEQEGHHPDIYLSYGKVKLSVWTHKIDGLSESDFIFASKCDEL